MLYDSKQTLLLFSRVKPMKTNSQGFRYWGQTFNIQLTAGIFILYYVLTFHYFKALEQK